MFLPEAIARTVFGALLLAAVVAALILVLVRHRRPASGPLLAAAVLLALSLVAAAISPVQAPLPIAAALAIVGTAVAVLGGDPVARRVLDLASDDGVREGRHGGILLRATTPGSAATPEVMRGGVTIGYLERAAAALSIVVGYPEAIAVVVAIKGIARFTELGSPEARERFIIGTLASLGWACIAAAAVHLAIW
ncbi:hypothetical protein [Microbacterium karelineae]|uniref:hypothetical protein n=1 Tax=Microbacterium karelineae TaxID=2654283 RepID=UPI0012E9D6FD|nr:hypothetical protein [Microbacterium karelineae]